MYKSIPPKGMRDFLPKEKALRDKIASRIKGAYTSCGFTEIETSAIENIENLTGGDGGENTKLIFKIMKRGEKLSDMLQGEKAITEDDLSDLGLRFDFTLPLSRFYSNNRNELPNVFKAIQMGMVYRGERPQKGRYRSFVQCDVDIIGDPTPLAEIEILGAATKALQAIGITDFEVLISDRRLLIALIMASGLPEEQADDICISLDKYDKVGREGVLEELSKKGFDGTKLLDSIESLTFDTIEQYSPEASQNLNTIQSALGPSEIAVRFEPTLVRGMGYYTSSIFEIYSPKYGLALGGGGRYDKMIGKISGMDAPAAGFSIGFERICDLVSEEELGGDKEEKIAILVEGEEEYVDAVKFAREQEVTTSIFQKKKKLGKQLHNLENEGFTTFYDVSKSEYFNTGTK